MCVAIRKLGASTVGETTPRWSMTPTNMGHNPIVLGFILCLDLYEIYIMEILKDCIICVNKLLDQCMDPMQLLHKTAFIDIDETQYNKEFNDNLIFRDGICHG